MTGPLKHDDRINRRSSLLNAIMTMKEEHVGMVELSKLKTQVEVGDTVLKQLLDDVQNAIPHLFVWLSESTIDVSPQSYTAERMSRNIKLKNAIADVVCQQLPVGATVACSSGTTTTSCIRTIGKARRQLFVTTNNVGILEHCATNASIAVTFVGGEYSAESHSCVGSESIQRFRETCCRFVLISVSGVNVEGDLFVFHQEESPIHSVLASMPAASRLVVVADASKLSGPDRWAFASLPDLHEQFPVREIVLVTNSPSTPTLSKNARQKAAETQESLKKNFGFLTLIPAEA